VNLYLLIVYFDKKVFRNIIIIWKINIIQWKFNCA